MRTTNDAWIDETLSRLIAMARYAQVYDECDIRTAEVMIWMDATCEPPPVERPIKRTNDAQPRGVQTGQGSERTQRTLFMQAAASARNLVR